LEIGCFLPRSTGETENPSLFSSLEDQPVAALSAAWSFAEALKHSPSSQGRRLENAPEGACNITVGGHSFKLHLLLLPDGRLEDLAITDARRTER
jgi:hypothetical protein